MVLKLGKEKSSAVELVKTGRLRLMIMGDQSTAIASKYSALTLCFGLTTRTTHRQPQPRAPQSFPIAAPASLQPPQHVLQPRAYLANPGALPTTLAPGCFRKTNGDTLSGDDVRESSRGFIQHW